MMYARTGVARKFHETVGCAHLRETVSRCLAVCLLLCAGVRAIAEEGLTVPPEMIAGGSPQKMMRDYLRRQADEAIDRWQDEYEKLKATDEIAVYQRRLREKFLEAIGGLPDRTPLAPQVVGTALRENYRVERIIFQSQPGHFVTALLFLPSDDRFKAPYPGVIIPCGHAKEAKAYPPYQSAGALLALNGMASLVFDPIDQGERGQYLGPGGWPKLWGTAAHTTLGVGCVLLGRNTARFEIWDGIRAIDYLLSRSEIDPQRIGCTGNSGGGTQTSYLMALDERIVAAAPSCYITSTSRLLDTLGPDDSEQQLFGQLLGGPHHADLLMMRAPSPVLVLAATRDFFDITGSWESVRYAKRLYTRMGFAERVDILENDAEHSFAKPQREGMARWMSRWLLGQERLITEPAIRLLAEEECLCTPEGRVMLLPEARSAYDLNEDYENELAKRRQSLWAGEHRDALLDGVRRLAGIRRLPDLPQPSIEILETVPRKGYKIEKLLIRPEVGIWLPALLFLPENRKPDCVTLFVHEQGKIGDGGQDRLLDGLVKDGHVILAVDLRGTGQTQPPEGRRDGPEYWSSYVAYMLGRSLVGMRAEDVLVSARYLAERVAGGRPCSVRLLAVGHVAIPALHAAALEPSLFQSVKLQGMLASWSHIIHNRLNRGQVGSMVHGALTHYDLPDLQRTLGDRVSVEEPVDAIGQQGSRPDGAAALGQQPSPDQPSVGDLRGT